MLYCLDCFGILLDTNGGYMDRKKIGMIVAVLLSLFSVGMGLFNYAINEYDTMVAYIIAFTGWLVVLLDESERKS